jgi:tRNA(Ile)-lysidine synthase
VVEQGTHKPLVGGSNPPSATSPDHPPDALAAAVARGAERLGLPDGIPIVLAVSGGPDSTALLHGAARLAPQRGWRLTVAHLDHGLRPSSAEEARGAAAAARALGLPSETRLADVAAVAAAEHRSIEDAGRQARYRFFEEVATAIGPDALIATAHTADDAAETVLLRLARGAGLRGLRGIPARRGRIVRPLLGERRPALRAALDAAGIAYTVDPTNVDPRHAARNRVRAELLPALERLNPAAVDALVRFGRLAADDDDLLDALAAAELTRRRGSDGSLDWRDPPPRALGRRVLRLVIDAPAPSAERIEALLDAAEGPRGGLAIELGAGRRASVRERRIQLG